MRKNKTYEFRNFLLDALMFVVTGGFWVLWIVIREVQIQTR